jgi:putative endonuclease
MPKGAKPCWLVYLLKCSDNSLYCGITNDLNKRLKQHSGELAGGAKYTRAHRPCRLVYKEISSSHSEALKRELEIKKMTKTHKEALVEFGKLN